MADAQLDLVAMIGSRICHDLISPIGAINNGLELLEMAGNAKTGPEISLIGESVGNASARIRFFRVSFGAAGDQLMGPAEVRSILRDLYDGGRLRVEWQPDQSQARAEVKLAFLAILCLESALPYGGKITVTQNAKNWQIAALADKLKVDPALWKLLASGSARNGLQPSHVQFALLPLIAADTGRQVSHQVTDTTLTISF
ncbi:histidine phosphotransferase [Sulfitobacter sp. EhC04]|uniref:histidine phosphotransferase family protein n=1 Tax=Sulfitobacter sp. EhC04 TaxID=1849168 RepID=UPI0007F34150|nr:histidine phosphotransferase family protein [Sulfitobacter sp. EhC04]OAN71563.1 histidine phosphotransferase [Sulfitobacter sp. EhC04]